MFAFTLVCASLFWALTIIAAYTLGQQSIPKPTEGYDAFKIAQAEYEYWRRCDDESGRQLERPEGTEGVVIGAMGACANIIAALSGQEVKRDVPGMPAGDDSDATIDWTPSPITQSYRDEIAHARREFDRNMGQKPRSFGY